MTGAAPGEAALAARLARVGRQAMCRLTHHGRTTGRAREVTLNFLVDGETVYLVTRDMGRHWPRNVLARPGVTLRVGGEAFEGRARPVTDAEEMRHVVDLLGRKHRLARVWGWLGRGPAGAFAVTFRGSGR